ncbi:MAG: cellulase family glycosylhydrolase [Candidatus Omnitrophica bacterium]|nr:cellulase family glycosylhydrolase [Candidatus Omnitrophota bacterium]
MLDRPPKGPSWVLKSIAVLLFAFPLASQSMTLTRAGSRLLVDNKPIRLVGYGCYGMVSESSFESVTFFDRLAESRINLVRVWVLFHWTNDLTPFEGSRASRYDLLKQNDAFYSRLKNFVGMAEERGIVVQVCLFDGVALTGDNSTNRWPNFPYNTVNNFQDYLTSPGQFNDVPSEWWSEVTGPLIDRVVDELGNFGNVIYEAVNEPDTHGLDTTSPQFDRDVVDRLYDLLHRPDYQGSKIISVNPEAALLREWAISYGKVDLVSYHIKSTDAPQGISDVGKPVLISNDGDTSQSTEAFGGLDPVSRLARIQSMLDNTFPNEEVDGTRHFECLDKGLYGSTWTTDNYDPRYENRNEEIIELLSGYAPIIPERPASQLRLR